MCVCVCMCLKCYLYNNNYVINTAIKINKQINEVNQFLAISNHFAINFPGAPEDTRQKFYMGKLRPEGLTPYPLAPYTLRSKFEISFVAPIHFLKK